jgi:hypothetical protein
MSTSPPRYIAVCLKDFALRLADPAGADKTFAVVVTSGGQPANVDQDAEAIAAASAMARRYGVRAGMRVAEARSFVPWISLAYFAVDHIESALRRVAVHAAADVGLRDVGDVGVALTPERRPPSRGPRVPDMFWLRVPSDQTDPRAERALIDRLDLRVRKLGDCGRKSCIVAADGPYLAGMVAWWVDAQQPLRIEPGREHHAHAIAPLPVRALPLSDDRTAFLLRQGVLAVGDVHRFLSLSPSNGQRIGPEWPVVSALLHGVDDSTIAPMSLSDSDVVSRAPTWRAPRPWKGGPDVFYQRLGAFRVDVSPDREAGTLRGYRADLRAWGDPHALGIHARTYELLDDAFRLAAYHAEELLASAAGCDCTAESPCASHR